ncbi:hypothetical protein Tsubulata_000924 [Turnera subulata]|uniref:Interactor of constitutive active ROPs 1 n=1 Tax=Turnera subulata TaxID=218843 RepID=A0A9Q0JJ06_9ROSI|nr:hypothetical protein Tsubulata_000924 [Turnera subulata]
MINSGSDEPLRQPRRRPHPPRTSRSDSDVVHHRPITERNPKLGPRGSQPDSINQKRLSTRILDLESQLVQAQEELKILKEQLDSAEAAKKEAQQELENKKPNVLVPPKENVMEVEESQGLPKDVEETDESIALDDDNRQETETDVFEVPAEKKVVVPSVDPVIIGQVEQECNSLKISTDPQDVAELEKSTCNDLVLKDDEIQTLKAKLEEKAKESEAFSKENENLKNQLHEAISSISSIRESISLRLTQLEEEVKARKENEAKLKEKLEATEGANEELKTEMKKMRVQTEQWRKAADAAAAVLAGNVEMNGRISERCGSMDKQFTGVFETPGGGYPAFVGSPGIADDFDDGFGGSGRRKGSGIKMFGDLWKKRGHK